MIVIHSNEKRIRFTPHNPLLFIVILTPLCYDKFKQSFDHSISNLNILMPYQAFKRLFA